MADSPLLRVGDRVLLSQRTWWTVRAVSDNFAALVQQVPFAAAGTMRYTVIDWRNGVRGPCNLIGQRWGDGSYTERECAAMLAAFERVEGVCPTRGPQYELEVSHRNRVALDIRETRRPVDGPSS